MGKSYRKSDRAMTYRGFRIIYRPDEQTFLVSGSVLGRTVTRTGFGDINDARVEVDSLHDIWDVE